MLIRPRANEDIQATLRRLRKLCEKEGVLKEIRKHSYYEKPSEKRRRVKRKAERKAKQTVQDDPRNKKSR